MRDVVTCIEFRAHVMISERSDTNVASVVPVAAIPVTNVRIARSAFMVVVESGQRTTMRSDW